MEHFECEHIGDSDHDAKSDEEFEVLYAKALETGFHWATSILNKDCCYEPISSFSESEIIAQTDTMFLVKR